MRSWLTILFFRSTLHHVRRLYVATPPSFNSCSIPVHPLIGNIFRSGAILKFEIVRKLYKMYDISDFFPFRTSVCYLPDVLSLCDTSLYLHIFISMCVHFKFSLFLSSSFFPAPSSIPALAGVVGVRACVWMDLRQMVYGKREL